MKTKVYLKKEKKFVQVEISDNIDIKLDQKIMDKWQVNIDLIADILGVKAVLIMQLKETVAEVAFKSNNPSNPYKVGGRNYLGHGLTCETVIGNDQMLIIKNAQEDEVWRDTSNADFKMDSYMGVPLKWPDGTFYGSLCVFGDAPLTLSDSQLEMFYYVGEMFNQDLKILSLENRIKQLSGEVEDSEYSKSQFLRDIATEVKTPLTTIVGLGQVGKNTSANSVVKDYFKQVTDAGNYLLEIVNEVTDISKIENDFITPKDENVDIFEFVDEMKALFEPRFKERNQKFTVTIQDMNPKTYTFDKTIMKRIVFNILENANSYTKENGMINWRISKSTRDGEELLVHQVTDNGTGMSPDQMERIFKPFPNKGAMKHQLGAGVGLGLSTTYSLVKMLEGEIQVSSQLGEGSSFVIRIPVKRADQVGLDNHVSETGDELFFNDKSALLVEDNNINAMTIKTILAKYGLAVNWVVNGSLAIDALENKKYDIVLMDVDMPVMNGIEATKLIRKRKLGGKVPIIALSPSAFVEDVDKSISAGMDDHLVKPIDTKQLLYILKRYL